MRFNDPLQKSSCKILLFRLYAVQTKGMILNVSQDYISTQINFHDKFLVVILQSHISKTLASFEIQILSDSILIEQKKVPDHALRNIKYTVVSEYKPVKFHVGI